MAPTQVEEPIDHGTQPESRIIERQGCARDDEHEHSQVPKDIDPEEVVAFLPERPLETADRDS
jgi:hypothetical protein